MKHAIRRLALAFIFSLAAVFAVSAGQLEEQLLDAAMNGYTNNVRTLIEKGANVNARWTSGSTALISAASNGYTEIVKILIEKGANVNAKDKIGSTVLWNSENIIPDPNNVGEAARRKEISQMLRKAGAR